MSPEEVEGLEKQILRFKWKRERPWVAKAVLKEDHKVGRSRLK